MLGPNGPAGGKGGRNGCEGAIIEQPADTKKSVNGPNQGRAHCQAFLKKKVTDPQIDLST